ncbi:MAG TPA: isocitrate lyase/phosphoenolpyruvate mutase family protein [Mycobacteriales bacterium]|nr:isocitrate lyase/phosphoenolpyruvate mutase family protein [Mycobacteriales bacterium]
MSTLTGKAEIFLSLHVRGKPLLQPNAFDAGSARLLQAAGFASIATTSSGFAATLGRRDGRVTRAEALEHFRAVAAAVDIPVAADAENCYADDPDGVAETIRLAAETGLAGCSVEDYDSDKDQIYQRGLAVERVIAAVEASRGRLVLTARAEDLLHGGTLDEAIARIQAYQEAGADVLFVPGLRKAADIRAVVGAVDKPVNVLVVGESPSVAELAEIGVARVSVGGSFTWVAYAAVLAAAQELREHGTYGYAATLATARPVITAALGD